MWLAILHFIWQDWKDIVSPHDQGETVKDLQTVDMEAFSSETLATYWYVISIPSAERKELFGGMWFQMFGTG